MEKEVEAVTRRLCVHAYNRRNDNGRAHGSTHAVIIKTVDTRTENVFSSRLARARARAGSDGNVAIATVCDGFFFVGRITIAPLVVGEKKSGPFIVRIIVRGIRRQTLIMSPMEYAPIVGYIRQLR